MADNYIGTGNITNEDKDLKDSIDYTVGISVHEDSYDEYATSDENGIADIYHDGAHIINILPSTAVLNLKNVDAVNLNLLSA